MGLAKKKIKVGDTLLVDFCFGFVTYCRFTELIKKIDKCGRSEQHPVSINDEDKVVVRMEPNELGRVANGIAVETNLEFPELAKFHIFSEDSPTRVSIASGFIVEVTQKGP